MARLIIVTGTPGVGKTTLSRLLALQLSFQFIDITKLASQKRLFRGYDQVRRSHLINEERLGSALRQTLRSDAVVSGHFIPPLDEMWQRQAVVLRLDPVVLWRRLRGRGWSRRKAWENVEAEMLDVCYHDAVNVLGSRRVSEIDVTGKSGSRVLAESLKFVHGSRKSPLKRVAWLGKYDPILLSRRLFSG